MTAPRDPYVGAGVDGYLRSAQIDREEADGLDRDDPRRTLLQESAAAWEARARQAQAVLADLDRARNLYGPLDPDARSRILAALERPTLGTWRAARTLIVAESMLTLWQAVLAYTDHADTSADAVPTARQIADGLAGATR